MFLVSTDINRGVQGLPSWTHRDLSERDDQVNVTENYRCGNSRVNRMTVNKDV